LVARDIEVEFVNFGRSLPQMLDATSTSKSTKAHKAHYGKFPPFFLGTNPRAVQFMATMNEDRFAVRHLRLCVLSGVIAARSPQYQIFSARTRMKGIVQMRRISFIVARRMGRGFFL